MLQFEICGVPAIRIAFPLRVNPSPLTPKWEVKIERGDGPATYE